MAHYFDDERLQRIFSFQSMYAGLAPYEALAIYCVITYMDAVDGVYFPEGGIHAVPGRWRSRPRRRASSFRYGTTVERIVLENGTDGAVTGVAASRVGDELIDADAVVCNPDLPVAYRTLLPGLRAPRGRATGAYSPSCIVWHAGVRGRPPPEAAHHNIHFGRQWDGAFRAILEDGGRMPDPSILVTVPSIDEPSMAPDGCSTLYVLEPTPNLDGRVDWTVERVGCATTNSPPRSPRSATATDVEVERLVDPLDWERQGHGAGDAVRARRTVLPDGPVPAGQHRQASARAGVRRQRDRSRRGRADGPDLGPAGGRTRGRS